MSNQIIIRNIETGTDWLSPIDEIWPIIPRIGESLLYTVENEEGQEDEEKSFNGTVEGIQWSTGNYGGFSVFICIRPNEAA